MNDNGSRRIRQGPDDRACMVDFRQCAGRAYCYALSAIGADRMVEVHFKCGGDNSIETPVDGRKGPDRLYFVAHHLAPAAPDAFVEFTNDGRRGIFAKS